MRAAGGVGLVRGVGGVGVDWVFMTWAEGGRADTAGALIGCGIRRGAARALHRVAGSGIYSAARVAQGGWRHAPRDGWRVCAPCTAARRALLRASTRLDAANGAAAHSTVRDGDVHYTGTTRGTHRIVHCFRMRNCAQVLGGERGARFIHVYRVWDGVIGCVRAALNKKYPKCCQVCGWHHR